MRASQAVGLLLLLLSPVSHAAEPGIAIRPDEEGSFVYEDDFSTPRCLTDAILSNTGTEIWTAGSLQTQGPARRRTLTYRFHGERAITAVSVRVAQRSNARHLGGQTTLWASANGLDWEQVADSKGQEGDANGWQAGPLTLETERAGGLLGGGELWLRLVLDNYSGLETYVSNIVDELRVELQTGEALFAAADPQSELKAQWAQLRSAQGWRSPALDCSDPPRARAPHYYEQADGWLTPPGENPLLVLNETGGFPLSREYLSEGQAPLSLATFVRTQGASGPLMVRLEFSSDPQSPRECAVLWDGEEVLSFDAASGIERRGTVFSELGRAPADGVHELRVAPRSGGRLLLRTVALSGGGDISWTERPDLAPGRELTVLAAEYLPDPAPPAASQVVEGRQKGQDTGLVFAGLQRLYQEHEDFGSLRLAVRNTGTQTVRIADLLLNDVPVDETYVDLVSDAWDARGVVWYRVRPRTLEAGECGQVLVRFRRRPEGEAARVTLVTESGARTEATVPYASAELSVDYVTTGPDGQSLLVYLRQHAPGIRAAEALSLDGEPLRQVRRYGADFPGGVALLVARLEAPLTAGGYHVVTATSGSGRQVAAQFRVLPWLFPRSSIHVPPELCEQMHMNLAMWHAHSQEVCERYGLLTSATGGMFDLHPRVAYLMGPDEPDAHDNRGGGYPTGLGYHARRLAQSGWQELLQRFSPQAASWIVMNGTVRPLNWCVYGRFADIACFDPYPVTYYGADHAYVRESLSYARLCGTPNRMYACLEAYGWKTGQGVPKGARGPVPAEWRQNVVQAIGCGMKGLTSWVYSAGAGGWQLNDEFAAEIAATNRLIEHIEGDLLLGTPVDLVSCDAGEVPTGVARDESWPKPRVAVSSLLCGPDTIVVTAANHIPASKPEPPEIEPAKNVSITVGLPDYIEDVECFEVTPEGEQPFACTVEAGRAILKVPNIESGCVFVLRRR